MHIYPLTRTDFEGKFDANTVLYVAFMPLKENLQLYQVTFSGRPTREGSGGYEWIKVAVRFLGGIGPESPIHMLALESVGLGENGPNPQRADRVFANSAQNRKFLLDIVRRNRFHTYCEMIGVDAEEVLADIARHVREIYGSMRRLESN